VQQFTSISFFSNFGSTIYIQEKNSPQQVIFLQKTKGRKTIKFKPNQHFEKMSREQSKHLMLHNEGANQELK
jgi:hypothetical protein